MQSKIAEMEAQVSGVLSDNQQNIDINAANPIKAHLTDAYVLARTAAVTLEQDGNVVVAKQLLELANRQLANLHGPKIIAVKDKLLADQEMLSKEITPDYAAVQNKLAQLTDYIKVLPATLMQSKIAENITTSNTAIVDSASDRKWLNALRNFFMDLRFIVKIKKKNVNDQNWMVSNTEVARSQLNLMIEQIRWALFHNNNVVYHNSLRFMQELLNNGFDTSNDSIQNSLAILQELTQVQLLQQMPNINDTVKSLQELLIG